VSKVLKGGERFPPSITGGIKIMDCGQVREKLSCYMDGVLDEATLETIEAHLESCAGCREELDALRSTLGLTSILHDVDPPASLSSSIKDAVAKERETTGSCAYYLVMMSEYIDDELQAEDAAELESHIALCDHCTKELTALRATVASAAMLVDVAPPAVLREQISSVTTGRKLVSPISLLRQHVAMLVQTPHARLAGAALAAAVMAGIIVIQPYRTRQKQIARAIPVPKPVVVQAPEQSTVVVTPIPTKQDTVNILRRAECISTIQSEKTKTINTQPTNVRPSTTAVKIAKHEEPAKPLDASSAVVSSTVAQDNVPATPEKKDMATSKSDEAKTTSSVETKPQSTFIKLAALVKPAAADDSNYFKDIKEVARMKQRSDDKLRVDVISAKF
jgi:anti-sigma factor RsiW